MPKGRFLTLTGADCNMFQGSGEYIKGWRARSFVKPRSHAQTQTQNLQTLSNLSFKQAWLWGLCHWTDRWYQEAWCCVPVMAHPEPHPQCSASPHCSAWHTSYQPSSSQEWIASVDRGQGQVPHFSSQRASISSLEVMFKQWNLIKVIFCEIMSTNSTIRAHTTDRCHMKLQLIKNLWNSVYYVPLYIL